MSSKIVRGVYFDWDLTLGRILGDVSIGHRLTVLFQRNGLDVSEAQVQAAIQQLRQDDDLPKPQTPPEIIAYYRQILSLCGIESISPAFGQQLYDGYALLPNILYDDALPTLRKLATRPLSLGIISNHSVLARETMSDLVGDIIPPERIIISDEVGWHKPAPAIYSLAAERMALPPASCVLVGDNPKVDAIAAVEVGGFQHGFWLDRTDSNGRDLPPYVTRLTTLHDLPNLL